MGMDEGHGGSKNNFIKGLISDKTGQGDWGVPGMKYDDQWWIGAHVEGPHSDTTRATGSGTTPTPPLNGTARTASLSSRIRISSDSAFTTGMIGPANMLPDTFARNQLTLKPNLPSCCNNMCI